MYSPPDNDAVDFDLEDATPPSNDAVDFTLAEEEVVMEDEPLFTGIRELELPLSVNLPTGALNLRTMETGVSVFFAGILALLLGGWWILKNYAAGAVWSMAIVLLIISGLFGIGLEFFWLAVIGCVLLLIAGFALRAGEG